MNQFHTVLTDRQRQIAKMALGAFDFDGVEGEDFPITAEEIQQTLDALTPPNSAELSGGAQRLPMYFLHGDEAPIGYGSFEGPKLVVHIHSQLVSQSLKRLAHLGDIRELYLSVGSVVPAETELEQKYQDNVEPMSAVDMRERIRELKESGHTEAETAERLGLTVSDLRSTQFWEKPNPDDVKQATTMHVEGYSNAEIADVLGLTENAVRKVVES